MLVHIPTSPSPVTRHRPHRGLRPPAGPGPLIHRVAVWAQHRPWLVLVALVVLLAWIVGSGLLYRWRHQRLTRDAQQITITTPPEVDPAGAAQFWATAYGSLYRVWWRRLIYGTPHLAYEYRWAGRALTIVVWVPGTVTVRPLAAAARAAWPAATVTVEAATEPFPGRCTAQRGGALLPVLPEAYPLRTDHDTDPLRQVIAAGTGLRHHEHACVQILARPAPPRRLARLRRAPAQLRDPAAHRGLDPATPLRWLLDLASPSATASHGHAAWQVRAGSGAGA